MTTVPLQQLFVLNSEFMARQAKALAAAADRPPSRRRPAASGAAFLLAYGRPPTDREVQLGDWSSWPPAGAS